MEGWKGEKSLGEKERQAGEERAGSATSFPGIFSSSWWRARKGSLVLPAPKKKGKALGTRLREVGFSKWRGNQEKLSEIWQPFDIFYNRNKTNRKELLEKGEKLEESYKKRELQPSCSPTFKVSIISSASSRVSLCFQQTAWHIFSLAA